MLVDGFGLAVSQAGVGILIVLPLFIATPVIVTLEIIKLKWGRFTKEVNCDVPFREGLQFKISHLLILTTIVAIAIPILQTASSYLRTIAPEGVFPILGTIIFMLSITALANVWAVLGRSIGARIFVSFLVAALACAVAIYFLSFFEQIEPDIPLVWGGMTAITWSTSLLLLYQFRREGYRFVR